MAEFLEGSDLNAELDAILANAEIELKIISPYIKLHKRTIDILKSKMDNHQLEIIVVFGKNGNDKSMSLSKEDFEFLSQFAQIEIRYEERLHAKYYANEEATLLTSMNLYDFSLNNNIEFGILAERKGFLKEMVASSNLDGQAWHYFQGVIRNSELIYKKSPRFEKGMLGLGKKYIGSEVDIDNSDNIFNGAKKKSQVGYQRQFEPKSNFAGKLLSATALGNTVDKKYNDVIEVMSKKGYVKEDAITAEGKKAGLDYKSNAKGDTWIVYPESLKEIL